MYAALFPLAQDAERIIQTAMALMRLGAADSQLDRLRREAVRERKAADALLLGGRLRRVRAERTVERLDKRLFAHAPRQILLRVLRVDDAHVRPLIGLALDVGQAHLALFVLEVAEQLDDRAAVQSEMVIGGQQAAQHALGERAAEGVLRGIAYSGKLAVLVSCAAKLGCCVLRRGIFALFGIFRLGSRRAQIVERERRALVALVG